MSASDPPIRVTAIDHVYVSVSDLARSEAFYDPVMEILGFKKGTRPIAGAPHLHYFNQVTQYTLRPGDVDAGVHDPYRPGALHHLCFQVADPSTVDAAFRALAAIGVAATRPSSYAYRPDYYATFFEDPDGVRLEIVCDTELRRLVRERWDELDRFVDPVSKLVSGR